MYLGIVYSYRAIIRFMTKNNLYNKKLISSRFFEENPAKLMKPRLPKTYLDSNRSFAKTNKISEDAKMHFVPIVPFSL